MGIFKKRNQRRELERIGAEVLHQELDGIIARGNATAARWRSELADVEQKLAAIHAEFDGFPGNGLMSSEIDQLEQMRDDLTEERRKLRGRIWLMEKPDHMPNEPSADWNPLA